MNKRTDIALEKLLKEIQEAKDEIKNGKIIPHSEMIKRIKAKKEKSL
jgi:hypothetical protein